MNLDFEVDDFEDFIVDHIDEVDYRIGTIRNPGKLECEPKMVETYDSRRIWEKAICVIQDDYYGMTSIYKRLSGIRRNSNMVSLKSF